MSVNKSWEWWQMTLAQTENMDHHASDHEINQTLASVNVNLSTGFATNYLNHYVEILLLLEMLPSMPEGIEDISKWQPMDYSDHVKLSGLPHSELVLQAFERAEPARRNMLIGITKEADTLITRFIDWAQSAVSKGDQAKLQSIADEAKEVLTPKIERISSVICSVNLPTESEHCSFA